MSNRPWSGSLKGQPDHRRNQRFVDQHGRPWSGTIEIKTGHPTGVLEPTWTKGLTQLAPNGAKVRYQVPDYLVPDQIYVKPHPTDHGVLFVDYPKMLDDLKEAWRDWQSRVSKTELKFHGDKANPKAPSAQTLDLAGAPPQRVELVLAMQAGNRWALGLSPKMPKWAKELLPASDVTEMDFPDAEEEEYLDAEDENVSAILGQMAEAGESEAERIARLETALAEANAKRVQAEAVAAEAKKRRVIVKAKKPALAGKES